MRHDFDVMLPRGSRTVSWEPCCLVEAVQPLWSRTGLLWELSLRFTDLARKSHNGGLEYRRLNTAVYVYIYIYYRYDPFDV